MLLPYIKNTQIFTCPSRKTSKLEDDGDLYDSSVGYAYNYLCSTWYYPHSLADVEYPSETCVFVDEGYYYLWYTGYYRDLLPDNQYYGVNGSRTLIGQHNDGNNCAFYDGHAKWFSLSHIHGKTGRYDPFNNWNAG
jgi:prepilin-type processing-associated H-X9-DG protein